MKLIYYPISGAPLRITPAPVRRDWSDQIGPFPYRCLPLNLANSHGWAIFNNDAFIAEWDGGASPEALKVQYLSERSNGLSAESHFGFGVLTFRVNALFRTDAGYNLWVGGPTNHLKDGIQALAGIVETDWSPTTFTVNWKFTRPGLPIVFGEGEPICMIFPLARSLIEDTEPEICDLDEVPVLRRSYELWSSRRRDFNDELARGSQGAKWQKDYFVGTVEGLSSADHQSKLDLSPFKRSQHSKNSS